MSDPDLRLCLMQIVKLSDAVQDMPRSVTQFVHGVPESFLQVGEKKAKVPADGGKRFSKGAYFIGKVCLLSDMPFWHHPGSVVLGARPFCRATVSVECVQLDTCLYISSWLVLSRWSGCICSCKLVLEAVA